MDSATATAMVTALSASANLVGLGVVNEEFESTYSELKALLLLEDADLYQSLELLEQQPLSPARSMVVREELKREQIRQDARIIHLAESLVGLLRTKVSVMKGLIGMNLESLEKAQASLDQVITDGDT